MVMLQAQDRRGLQEIVTWASILVVLGVLNVVYMVLSARKGQVAMDPVLLGALTGAVTALAARGTQGASERSGSSDALNAAASAMRQVIGELVQSKTAATPPTPPAPPAQGV